MAEIDLGEVIRREIRALKAYEVERREGRIRLDANESPYPPPADLLAEILEALSRVAVHRYPDASAEELRDLLAARLGARPSRVVVGNGSDELIQILLTLVAGPGRAVAAPVPTFGMYAIGARALGLRFVGVPLGKEFALEGGPLWDALRREGPRAVFFAYPNNPTGNCFDPELLQEVIREFPGLVVVDEAYYDYSGKTLLPLLDAHPNLVVLRTLSKIGLAGLRLGILVAREELVAEVHKVRLPYNVNALSQAAARVVLSHPEATRARVEALLAERERVSRGLQGLAGVEVFPSEANFLLIRTPFAAPRISRRLAAEGVLVRSFGATAGLEGCLRVTIGTPPENDGLLEALGRVLARAAAEGEEPR